MSAASSAASQVRRPAAPSPQAAAAPRPAMRAPQAQAAGFSFVAAGNDDEIRINLGDIQFEKESMEIEGLKPSLLSRLFDLVSPLK